MKHLVILLILAVASTSTYSQTKLIAYKSHSGNLAYFSPESNDMLGMPYMPKLVDRQDTVIKFDSSIVEIMALDYAEEGVIVDTIHNHPYCILPEYTLKDLKKQYPPNTIYIGFDKKKDAAAKEIDNANPSLKDTERDNQLKEKVNESGSEVDENQIEIVKPTEKLKSKSERNALIPILLIIVLCSSTGLGIYFWNKGKKHITIE